MYLSTLLEKSENGLQKLNICVFFYSKLFEPRSIRSLYSVIVRVRVVLKRTVVGD